MKLETIRRLLASLKARESFPVSEYPNTAGRIAKAANVPRITAYRYLKKLAKLELVKSFEIKAQVGTFSLIETCYALTPKSDEFLESYREMI